MDLSHRRQLVQIASGLLLMVGVFLPVRAMRYYGSQGLFVEDPTLAALIVVIGPVAIVLAVRAATRWVPLLGAIALLLWLVALVSTIQTVGNLRYWPAAPLASALSDRPAYADVEPALRWGAWLVMLLGAGGLAASHFITIQTDQRAAVRTGRGRYKITGFERDTQVAVSTYLQADSAEDAENRAVKDKIIVTGVSFEPIRRNPLDAILARVRK
jgi:uncharacterized membrane protein